MMLDLTRCTVTRFNADHVISNDGYRINVDIIAFTHPGYNKYWNEGKKQFKEFERSYVCFTIINN